MDELTLDGIDFTVEVSPDADMQAPWIEYDFAVEVHRCSSYYRKQPGDRIIHKDRDSAWVVDFTESLSRARIDGWQPSDHWITEFTKRHGRNPSKRELKVLAVEESIDYCRRWLTNDWEYVELKVYPTDHPDDAEYLGGVESFAYMDQAREMASEIIARIKAEKAYLVRS